MGSSFSQGRILLERPIPHAEHGFCSVLFATSTQMLQTHRFFPPMQTLRFGSNHRNDPFPWLKRTFFPPDFLGCFWGIPAWDLYLILTASPFVQSHVPSCCSSVTPSQYVLLLLMLFFRKAWDEEIH